MKPQPPRPRPEPSSRPAWRRAPIVRLSIVDRHQVLLDGLAAWLDEAADHVRVVGAFTSWQTFVAAPKSRVPDVVLLSSDEVEDPPVPVRIRAVSAVGMAPVVYGPSAEPTDIRQCLAAGALGYVFKAEGAPQLLSAVEHAQRGRIYLSPGVSRALTVDRHRSDEAPRLSKQESQVLALYASGMSMRCVAESLDIGYETAKSYLLRVRVKYSDVGRVANSKIELRSRAIEDGLISH